MSKAGKLVKDLVKTKKESVMGKLANGDDPMEPWSKRYDSPIKEDDTWLYRYIRSLGWDPTHMTFAQQSKYSRSNAFKTWKKSHMELTSSTNEEVEELDEAGTGLLMSYIKSKGLDPRMMNGNQKASYSKSSEFRKFKNNHLKEVSGMGERGDDWNEASSPAQQAAIAIDMKKKGIKPKNMKEEADAKDTVCMDIPLLIRVLEFTREDMKTDIELHNMVERLIDMRHEVPLTMDNYDAITGKLKESKDVTEASYINGVKQDPESKVWKLTSLSHADAIAKHGKENVRHVDAVNRSGDKTGRKHVEVLSKLGEEVEQIDELKKQNDNMEIDDHITREEKKMKGPDPCWKGYQMVGTKKKGGREVPNCVPEEKQTFEEGLGRMIAKVINKVTSAKKAPLPQKTDRREYEVPGKTKQNVQEGIYGIEDSPQSATNSVKAMESNGRKKEMTKSARMIKSIYKKKNVKETLYDWEKTEKGGKVVDEPTAKIIMKGGTTMTGKPRDTVEIEPALRTKLNRPAGMNPGAQ